MFNRAGGNDKHQPLPKGVWFKRCTGIFLLITVILVLVLLAGSLMIGIVPMLDLVSATISTARPWLHSAQLATIALIWLRWQSFVGWLDRRGMLAPRMREPLLASRHRIMMWVLVFQILIVMRIPFQNPFVLH